MNRMNAAAVGWCVTALLVSSSSAAQAAGITERISVTTSGAQAHSGGAVGDVTPDGRFVTLSSYAWLVSNDTGYFQDVYIRDRLKRTTERVSTGSAGQGDDQSYYGALSDDTRFVAFGSRATNLVAGDTNRNSDVIVRDGVKETTERVSISSSGTQGNGHSSNYSIDISGDGRFVVFDSSATNLVPGGSNPFGDVFIHDRARRTTELVSVGSSGKRGNKSSGNPKLSRDGRFVAFSSDATDLAPGDTNKGGDVFIRDRVAIAPSV